VTCPLVAAMIMSIFAFLGIVFPVEILKIVVGCKPVRFANSSPLSLCLIRYSVSVIPLLWAGVDCSQCKNLLTRHCTNCNLRFCNRLSPGRTRAAFGSGSRVG